MFFMLSFSKIAVHDSSVSLRGVWCKSMCATVKTAYMYSDFICSNDSISRSFVVETQNDKSAMTVYIRSVGDDNHVKIS